MVKMTVVMEVMKGIVLHLPVARMSFSAIVPNVSPSSGFVTVMLTVLITLMNRQNAAAILFLPS